MPDTSSDHAPGVHVQVDVPAQMRDGVVLRANVYRPTGDGPWPTLLTRLPYSKDNPEQMLWLDPVQAALAGFMVVVQDTRGSFRSEGESASLRFEGQDGYDTVEWVARLPGSNGRVGMFGASYVGYTQWMAAVEQPPSLAAIAPALTWSEPLDGSFTRGGALEHGLSMRAAVLGTGAEHLAGLPILEDERQRRLAALLDDYDRLAIDGYWDLPVHEMAVLRRHGVPPSGTRNDPAHLELSRVAGRHERVVVPTLHIGGWYDVFIQGTLDNYKAMAALGRRARLVVGPWTHLAFGDPIGEVSFGVRSSRLGPAAHRHGDLSGLQLAWFEQQLAWEGLDADTDDGAPPVRVFVMGRNRWRDEWAWPPPRARVRRWFLHSGGDLRRDAPSPDAQPARFAYDPADPVPTVGGHLLASAAYPPGPYDQSRIEAREDVLVFTSEPLAEDLDVTGRVTVVLHAESSAPATDWVARLCDVHPDGRSFNICDGIVRISADADTCGRVEVDLWSTSNVFLADHRLRVHVTSSSFPRWDRNLNTGDQLDARFEVAHQRVYHDAQRASWIELPIIAQR